MFRASLITLALVGASMPAEPIQAQEATPTHVVMRYFKCAQQGAAVANLQEGRAIVDQMIAEGKFLQYGILAHNWGDEWNVVDFFVVDGIDSFFGDFGELLQRTNAAAEGQEEDDDGPSFGENCTEHKDNIYTYVAPPM